ncbi:galactose oxidase [Cyanobium sp. ATX 6A2]|uniref:galactose oxidase n=1 Tax=Cyanobium sp. ATX 6A2 TaxID=2823700 RepID=UPI0020CDD90F|nr:galactose oxidase [Cyanobium sp. ATX 6A2]MCP9889380.1 galactose oxidase [Cyanobium sp. ATX 6A2]
MGSRLRRSPSPEPSSGRLELPVEDWPYLDRQQLQPSRSRMVCMTCHFFRHHSGVNCIPLLTCQLRQSLLAQGEHLTHRCQGWTDDMAQQRGWAPKAG